MTFVSKRASFAVGVFVAPNGPFDHDAIRFLSLHADEIIVLDAHGFDLKHRWSDHTNVSIIEHTWSDCFSEARNRILESVSSDYILMVESDEHVGFSTLKAVREYLNTDSHPRNHVLCLRLETYGEDETIIDVLSTSILAG